MMTTNRGVIRKFDRSGTLPYACSGTMTTKSRSTLRTSGTKRGSTKPADARAAAGWAALSQGRWDAAKSAFADALVHDESPESLEVAELGGVVARRCGHGV
jgi:hypothetical protein